MPAQLDPSIILNSDHDRVVVAQNEVNQRAKEAAARIAIDSQEAELRRQEIMARRDEIIQRAMERNQPKPYDPKQGMEEYDLQAKQGQAVYNQLVQAKAHPEAWSVARQNLARIAGPDALTMFPEDVNAAMPIIDQHIAAYPAAAAKATAGKLERVETVDPTDPTKKGVLFKTPVEGEFIPGPPTPTATSTPNPTMASLAVAAAKGDAEAAAALKIMKAQQASGSGGVMSAGESAKRSDAKTVAQGIKQFADTGEGISPEVLISGRTTEQGMALNAELQKMGVDTSKLTREWLATKGAIRSLDGAGQIRLAQVINKASASLDRLDELNKQWSQNATRWGIKALNHGELVLAQNGRYGPEAAKVATNLESQIADVTAELGQGIMGGNSPTDRALILASHNLSTDWTQPVLDSGIKQVRYNLNLAQTARNEMLNQLGVQSTQFQTPAAGSTLPPPPTERVNPFRPKAK